MVTVVPATKREPFCVPFDEDAAAVKATVPLPVPLAPDVIVIQVVLLVAVQLQPEVVVIEIEPVPPLNGSD